MARAALARMSWEGYSLRSVQNANPTFIPSFLYGTAWKKDRTTDLVHQAIGSGFRAVDTAGQPKHYREDLVGEAIRRAIGDGIVRREDLYVCWRTLRIVLSDRNAKQLSGSNKIHICPGAKPR